MMFTLQTARDALAAIDGVVSCKVGLEANISPASYPMIRVVPSRIVAGKPYGNRTIEALLYFGAPTANSEGLEDVYANLSALEAQILSVIRTLKGRYVETITDEDRLPLYKLMVVRCELQESPHHASGGGLAAQDSTVAGAAVETPL